MKEYLLLALGKSGSFEISLDQDNEDKTYMNIDDGVVYLVFQTRTDEEQLLRSVVSFLKGDGELVCRESDCMSIGKFGNFRVELLKDDEYEEEVVLLIGRGAFAMRHYFDKKDFIIACEGALGDL